MDGSGWIFGVGLGVAVVAAIRGTWSPCGQSMLSSITPVTETARGHRYRATVGFFMVGAVAGGALVGAAAGLGSIVVGTVGPGAGTRTALLAVAALVGAVVDAGFAPWRTPFLRRQVNEDWLSGFRAWVYGGGFGFQIGTGVLTYVMTTAVFLAIAAAVLTGTAWQAVAVMTVFGLVRGSAIFLGAGAHSFPELQQLHRRLEAWREPIRRLTIGTLGAASVLWAVGAGAAAAVVVALAAIAVVLVVAARRADRGTDPALVTPVRSRPVEPALR